MQLTKIEWVANPDGTLLGSSSNPISGCKRGCPYCYARRIAERFGRSFEPAFHPAELEAIRRRQKPTGIFLGSMAEMFAEYIPDNWVARVFETVLACPQHRFYFLTKNPHLLAQWNPWPPNAWCGATATDADMALTAVAYLRPAVDAPVKYLSVEPMLGPFVGLHAPNDWDYLSCILDSIQWLIIGAQTGPGCQLLWPQRAWVDDLVEAAVKRGVKVFMKGNLLKPFPDMKLRQEFPDV